MQTKTIALAITTLVIASISAIILTIVLLPKHSETREFNWTVGNILVTTLGVQKMEIGINNEPGRHHPILVKVGTRVVINVVNTLSEPTSLHWHGLKVDTQQDGAAGVTQCAIPPGGSRRYVIHADTPGTYWWHSHYKGQYGDGLRGVFIVGGRDDDIVVELTDYFAPTHHDLEMELRDRMRRGLPEPTPLFGLVNGGVSSLMVPSRRNFVRLLNMASSCDFVVEIDGKKLTVVGIDGEEVVPYIVDKIKVSIGQRYNVLVDGDGGFLRAYMLHGNDLPHNAYDPFIKVEWGFGHEIPTPQGMVHLNDIDLVPLRPQPIPQPDFVFTHTFGLYKGLFHAELSDASGLFMNSSWRAPSIPTLHASVLGLPHEPSENVVKLPVGSVVQIIIEHNKTPHQFHLHNGEFWILGKGRIRFGEQMILNEFNPIKRDTVLLDGCILVNGICDPSFTSYAVVRFVVSSGANMFHCHSEFHMLLGLGFTIVGEGGAVPELDMNGCHF